MWSLPCQALVGSGEHFFTAAIAPLRVTGFTDLWGRGLFYNPGSGVLSLGTNPGKSRVAVTLIFTTSCLLRLEQGDTQGH